MLRNHRNLILLFCLTNIFTLDCLAQKAVEGSSAIREGIYLKQVLSWLPADTESLQVANGPFWMSTFQTGQGDYQNHQISAEELEKQFEGLTLGLFNSGKGLLEKNLERKKVVFALEGSRHFRPPAGLGELPFEGCEIAIFQDDLDDRRDAFMKNAVSGAARIEDIEGKKVVVFKEPMEQDVWTIFVTFPQKGVVLVATNREYLQEVMARMQGGAGERAFPDDSPEWKYVNKKARFWGLRHFDRRQANEDPSSPFGGRKSANIPDNEAVGLAYGCDPIKERIATITYLSGARANLRQIEEGRFPISSDPVGIAGLHIKYQELEPGVMRTTYDLSFSNPINMFFFCFMGNIGHAVYL